MFTTTLAYSVYGSGLLPAKTAASWRARNCDRSAFTVPIDKSVTHPSSPSIHEQLSAVQPDIRIWSTVSFACTRRRQLTRQRLPQSSNLALAIETPERLSAANVLDTDDLGDLWSKVFDETGGEDDDVSG